ncbi:hypothetical protein CAPTEDRAFT_178717 [Capitella teleta]|uniref:Ribosome biogenesis protein WDR12 homolog n=1 Tax=Capitella teleta TaxID=283909 RepID=R7TBS4_CAPTE|nr:hypothetical protein CAPTEDRAFT_178717 [Capitella teleta]|eukprot:ELT91178.1 hypothetical protein CAPTEDRAFT_178717 [Capitella teleta]
METDGNVPHVQAKFFTKQKGISVPDSPFSIPYNVGVIELSSLINSLLSQDEAESRGLVNFDFLVDGEFLREPLNQFLQRKEASTESVIDIEYLERQPAPEPEDALVHDDWVAALAASQDYILTGCYDNVVRVWNTEGDLLMTIPGHSGPVKCLAWLHNEDGVAQKTFVTGSHDETLLVWRWNQQTNSLDCVHSCRGHAGSVDTVTVSPNGQRFCTGSWDKLLKIWSASLDHSADADDDEAPQKKKKKTDGQKLPSRVPLLTLSGHSEGVSSALWVNEDVVATASWDHTIRLWDLHHGIQKSAITGAKVFLDLSICPETQLMLAASADRHVRLYDHRITDGASVKSTFTSHTAWVSSVSWSPCHPNQFISGSYDAILKLWDTRSPKAPLYDMTGHEDKILAVDWSMPQYMLSGGADNHLKIFSYQAREAQIPS